MTIAFNRTHFDIYDSYMFDNDILIM